MSTGNIPHYTWFGLYKTGLPLTPDGSYYNFPSLKYSHLGNIANFQPHPHGLWTTSTGNDACVLGYHLNSRPPFSNHHFPSWKSSFAEYIPDISTWLVEPLWNLFTVRLLRCLVARKTSPASTPSSAATLGTAASSGHSWGWSTKCHQWRQCICCRRRGLDEWSKNDGRNVAGNFFRQMGI